MNTTDFLAKLEGVHETGNGWKAQCPAHDDQKPSLGISEGKDGRILLRCRVGCSAENIVAALGLKLADLFPTAPANPKRRIVATYDYTDEGGKLLFQTLRYDPKDFRQRRPDPQKPGEWLWNLKDTRRVLYRLPEVKAAMTAGRTIFTAEGEKDCDALAKAGFVATCNPMGADEQAGKWLPEHTEMLRGAARVVLIADKDEPNPKTGVRTGQAFAAKVAARLHGLAGSVKLIELPDVNGKAVKDAFDFFTAGGTADQLRAIVKAAPEFEPVAELPAGHADSVAGEYLPAESDDDETLARLAALPPLEYERQRKVAAERMGIKRLAVLDKLVDAQRPKPGEAGLQGQAVDLANVEPWPEAADGAELLDDIAKTFGRYVALPDGAADALALWCAHAHAFKAFLCSPRLNISSPEKGCGKTTLRDVVAVLVPRALLTENLSVAVLFRLVEKHAPTILADEYDAWLRDNEELRGLLNAGHRRGATVFRCEGEGNEVRGFAAYAPAVLCGIGALPGTLHDRSIVIRLERAKPGEIQERFDSRRTAREQELCRKLARWTADNFSRLADSDPTMPDGVFNRLADNWRPLFALAEIAGGDWPRRAAEAFAKLTSRHDADAQGLGVMLLADIQRAFVEANAERMLSKTLVDRLCAMTERPWPEAHRGHLITQTWLARRLHPFGVASKTIRVGEERANGYERAHFQEAFERYLPDPGLPKCDSVTTPGFAGQTPTFGSVTTAKGVTDAEPQETLASSGLSCCHASIPPAEERETEALLL